MFKKFKALASFIVTVICFTVGAYLNSKYLSNNTQKILASIREESLFHVENNLKNLDSAVERMSQRLDYLGPKAELEFWKADAKNYIENIPFLVKLIFVDKNKAFSAEKSNQDVIFSEEDLSQDIKSIIKKNYRINNSNLIQINFVKPLWNQKGYIIATVDLKGILEESIVGFKDRFRIQFIQRNKVTSAYNIVLNDLIFEIKFSKISSTYFEQSRFVFLFIVFLGILFGGVLAYSISLFQKMTDEASELKIVDKKISLILESSSLGFWTWRPHTSELTMDQNCLQMLGYNSTSEINLSDWSTMIHPDHKDSCLKALSQYINGDSPSDENVHQIKRQDGEYIWVLDRGRVTSRDDNGVINEIMGTYTNITSLKEYELEIANQKNELKALIQATDDTHLKINVSGEIVAIFKSFNEVLDVNDNFIGQNITLFMNSLGIDDFNQIRDLLLLSQRECEFEFTHTVKNKKHFFKAKLTPLQGDQILITFKNKTSEVEVFEEINKQKSKFKTLFETAPYGMAYCFLDGKIVEANNAFKEMIDYTQSELDQLTYWDLTPRKYEAKEILQLESLEKTGRYGPYVKEYIKKDGSIVPVELSGMLVDYDNGEKAIWSIVQDLTEKKETQQLIEEQRLQTIKASKMAALGHMSGGVAHEINNPLTIISGNTSMLKKSFQKEEFDRSKAFHRLETIESNIERISRIIQSLRLFSKEGDFSQRDDLELNSIFSYAQDMVSEKLKSLGVELRIVGNTSVFINVSKFQVGQVFFNLLSNSIDAIRNLPEKWIEISVHERKNNVIIRITDSGKIEDEKIIENLFTPFFTTKEVGQGMGLGLSVSRGIIESYGGSLEIDMNDPNSCFVIIIPSCALAQIA